MKLIDKSSILIIHYKLIERYGGIHGLRNEGSLESAVKAAENRYHYETKNFAKLAATYAFHLSQAHAFLDGNKRIAAAAATVFLQINDIEISASPEEIIKVFLDIAASKLSRAETEEKFAAWVAKAE